MDQQAEGGHTRSLNPNARRLTELDRLRRPSTARTAAAMRRSLEVDLEVAGFVTLEQLDALQMIARQAGVDEVIVCVERRR